MVGPLRELNAGVPFCVTGICWPRSAIWAVRAAPLFAVKEKLTTPPETAPIVSQL